MRSNKLLEMQCNPRDRLFPLAISMISLRAGTFSIALSNPRNSETRDLAYDVHAVRPSLQAWMKQSGIQDI